MFLVFVVAVVTVVVKALETHIFLSLTHTHTAIEHLSLIDDNNRLKWKSCCETKIEHIEHTQKRTSTMCKWMRENKLLKTTTQTSAHSHPLLAPVFTFLFSPPSCIHTHTLPNKLQWLAGYKYCHTNWKKVRSERARERKRETVRLVWIALSIFNGISVPLN